jgi:hypothetical protein
MEVTDRSADEVLDGLAEPQRTTMTTLDEVVVRAMPGRSRRVWEGVLWGGTQQTIIGYGDIVQSRPRGADVAWFLVGLAQQQRHTSLYVNAIDEGGYLGAAYAERLGRVRVGAASVAIPRLDAIDLDVLAELCAHADRVTPPD